MYIRSTTSADQWGQPHEPTARAGKETADDGTVMELLHADAAVPVKAAMPEPVRVRHSWGKAIPQVSSII